MILAITNASIQAKKTMKKFAIVLSGCGFCDGAEIHEATLSLLAIARQGCRYEIFAPDIDQHHVIKKDIISVLGRY